jgi:hypothetical protein
MKDIELLEWRRRRDLERVAAWLRDMQRQQEPDTTPGDAQVARPVDAAKWGWDQRKHDELLALLKRANAEIAD